MPKETEDRVNVAIERETHEAFSHIAKLRGMSLKEAVDEAVKQWNKRNAAAAQKKMSQVVESAA